MPRFSRLPYGHGATFVAALDDLVSGMRAEVVALWKREAHLSPEMAGELEALTKILVAVDREESAPGAEEIGLSDASFRALLGDDE